MTVKKTTTKKTATKKTTSKKVTKKFSEIEKPSDEFNSEMTGAHAEQPTTEEIREAMDNVEIDKIFESDSNAELEKRAEELIKPVTEVAQQMEEINKSMETLEKNIEKNPADAQKSIENELKKAGVKKLALVMMYGTSKPSGALGITYYTDDTPSEIEIKHAIRNSSGKIGRLLDAAKPLD